MVIKFNTTDYLTYKYIYGLDNLTALCMSKKKLLLCQENNKKFFDEHEKEIRKE